MRFECILFICYFYLCWTLRLTTLEQIMQLPSNYNDSLILNESTVEEIIPAEGINDEVRLLRELLRGYDKDVRPMKNTSHAVVIRLGITLTQIFDLDEKNQVLMTSVWLDMEWFDDYLSWNTNDYNGLKNMRIPCEKLWVPDIVLYNNADDYTQKYMNSKAMVTSDGNVFWPPPTKMRSKCPVDVTYFPFDQQSCELKFGSWMYDGFQVDVTNRSSQVDVSNYVPNGEWELVETKVKRNVVYYPCCPEPFPDVTITIVIRRKTLYYISNVILPCVMMSGLTLLVFRLPPDAGEKIVLGFTVLLAFSVFILNIGEKMPETSNSVPLIGMYLTSVMAITSLSITMTVVVLSYHYRSHVDLPRPPRWLKFLVFNRLGSLLCSDVVLHSKAQRLTNFEDSSYSNIDDSIECEIDPSNQLVENSSLKIRSSKKSGNIQMEPVVNCESENVTVEENCCDNNFNFQLDLEFLKMLILMINRHKCKAEASESLNEWRTIALVLDRFLFWAFLIAIILSSTIFLLAVPYTRNGLNEE